MNTTLAAPITSDLRVILIDETEHWSPEMQEKCGKISCAYLYDDSVNVFLCELTPSKELTPLYYVTENEIDDETDEVLNWHFAMEEPIAYAKLPKESERNEVKQEYSFEFADARSKEYRNEFDDMWEACRCNRDF